MRFFGRSDRFNSFAPDCTAPDVTIAKLIPPFLNSFIETASESITSSRRTSSSTFKIILNFKFNGWAKYKDFQKDDKINFKI